MKNILVASVIGLLMFSCVSDEKESKDDWKPTACECKEIADDCARMVNEEGKTGQEIHDKYGDKGQKCNDFTKELGIEKYAEEIKNCK